MDVLQMSVSAAMLILIVAVIRVSAINRLPKTMFLALWGIALCRLIIPFSIPLKFGLYNLINRLSFVGKAGRARVGGARVFIYENMEYMETVNKPLQLEPMMMLWMVGAVLLILFFIVSFNKSYREIRTALPIKDNPLIDRWIREIKTYRSISVLVSDKATTPLTYGIIKPKIILPKVMDYSNEIQMRYILTHELIHIKRLDALWKLLLISALCLHWFNPMVWVLYVLMNRDLEIACDEEVIKLFGDSTKSDYALSLIEMAESRTQFTPLYSSFSKNATEERIVSIMKFKKTSIFSLVLAFILVAGATLVFAESTVNTIHQIRGVIETDSGRFSFEMNEKGKITVKDAEGRIISKTSIGSDGEVILTDDSGNVIETLHLNIPIDIPKDILGKRVLLHKPGILSEKGIVATEMLQKLIAEVNENGFVTIKDTEGNVLAAGRADNSDAVIIMDNNGVKIGAAMLENGSIAKLIINLNNNDNRDAVFKITNESLQ
ncbi:Signal transducer regulating beta-lactamase production, contains metallopeptidase domain [Anaerovirgula multivorans]|uniref:Signal transducer regulating beta-lactamase production, contains metallopeptidase domain n=1 Tax=Anaerovirgula multivorans TaxID=312168 RepID=A0A239IIF8_9FIRM|nr:M56 family metallopeptidase [Anaerovirgula multivorans]SNS93556.1 Signal transducer regulating beta-lactamase production, contains metallopeptidase domain [Anaerovirgula multivorans]